MKKMILLLSLCVVLGVGVAIAMAEEDGAALYRSCSGCHGADGSKVAMGVGKPLKGQTAEALYSSLKGYAEGTFGGPKKSVMVNIVKRLDDQQMKALADHMATF